MPLFFFRARCILVRTQTVESAWLACTKVAKSLLTKDFANTLRGPQYAESALLALTWLVMIVVYQSDQNGTSSKDRVYADPRRDEGLRYLLCSDNLSSGKIHSQ